MLDSIEYHALQARGSAVVGRHGGLPVPVLQLPEGTEAAGEHAARHGLSSSFSNRFSLFLHCFSSFVIINFTRFEAFPTFFPMVLGVKRGKERGQLRRFARRSSTAATLAILEQLSKYLKIYIIQYMCYKLNKMMFCIEERA